MVQSASIFLTISALIYTVILTFVFFSKRKVHKLENKIYGKLLIITIISMITELSIIFTKDIHVVGTLIQKLFLVVILLWQSEFMMYAFTTAVKNNSEKKEAKYVTDKFINILYSIFVLLNAFIAAAIIVSPIYFYDSGNIKYTYGPSVNIIFAVTGVYSAIMLILLLVNIKDIKKRGFIPIIFLLILLLLEVVIQKSHPEMLLSNAVFGLMIFIMYYAIENPDMVMLEEIMSSKKLNEQANEEKSNMILKITDKVRNPITEISNISGYLLTKNKDSEVEAGLKDIKKISDNAYDYINNALDISGADSSLLQETKYDYNLNTLLNELVLQNKDKVGAEVEFRTNFAKTLPTKLNGDGVKLKQIITTVLLNSIKHTTKGFIEFNVDQVTKYDVCRLLISIEDTGAGISQSKINELLNVKEDLTEEEASKLNELDLNLNIVNKLLRLIGGTINITSEEGKGTKIDIVLDQKISNNQDKEVEKLYEYGNYEFNKKKVVLISEDEAYTREFKRNATGLNINLECLNSAKECLDKIRNKEDIEVIFAEEDLSKINASDLLVKLKNEDNFNNKIVLISNCEVADQIKEYLDKGFYKVLRKNAPKKEVVDTINKLLDM